MDKSSGRNRSQTLHLKEQKKQFKELKEITPQITTLNSSTRSRRLHRLHKLLLTHAKFTVRMTSEGQVPAIHPGSSSLNHRCKWLSSLRPERTESTYWPNITTIFSQLLSRMRDWTISHSRVISNHTTTWGNNNSRGRDMVRQHPHTIVLRLLQSQGIWNLTHRISPLAN